MQIILNKEGYVQNYATIGMLNGIEVSEPTDLNHFEENYQAYSYDEINGLVFNEGYSFILASEIKKEELRIKREQECFPIINRGKLWYDNLSENQLAELDTWYQAWLDVTETLTIPEKPAWLI